MLKALTERILSIVKSHEFGREDEDWSSFLEFEILDKSMINDLIEKKFSKLYIEYVWKRVLTASTRELINDFNEDMKLVFKKDFNELIGYSNSDFSVIAKKLERAFNKKIIDKFEWFGISIFYVVTVLLISFITPNIGIFFLVASTTLSTVFFPLIKQRKAKQLYKSVQKRIELIKRFPTTIKFEEFLKNPEIQIDFINEEYPKFVEDLKKPYKAARVALHEKIDKHMEQLTRLKYGNLLLENSKKMNIELELLTIVTNAKNAYEKVNSVVASFAKHLEQVKVSIVDLENKIERKKKTEDFLNDVESSIRPTVELIDEIDVLTEILGNYFLNISLDEAVKALEDAKLSVDTQEILLNLKGIDS